MQGFINFIRAIADSFKTAFGKEEKAKGRRPPIRKCSNCENPLFPEETRAGICADCVELSKRQQQDA